MSDSIPSDWDGAWKESIVALLPWFLALFFPEAFDAIDWSRGFEPLDKELQKLVPESVTGPRRCDLLFKVWLKSGQETWVLIHIEIQAQRESDFPERIHLYHHRIQDRDGRPVASLAILADDEPGWRPGPYAYNLWGCRGEFHYPTVKLLDFAKRIEELERSENPFAIVVVAHLKARETIGDRARRREWKVRLLKGLYNRGWKREDVRGLLTAIDWFLTLPREDDRWVREEIEADEQEKKMPYITSFERIATEEAEARGESRGEARGRMDGLRDGIALALKVKFGGTAAGLITDLHRIDDIESLRRVRDAIESAKTIDDVARVLSS